MKRPYVDRFVCALVLGIALAGAVRGQEREDVEALRRVGRLLETFKEAPLSVRLSLVRAYMKRVLETEELRASKDKKDVYVYYQKVLKNLGADFGQSVELAKLATSVRDHLGRRSAQDILEGLPVPSADDFATRLKSALSKLEGGALSTRDAEALTGLLSTWIGYWNVQEATDDNLSLLRVAQVILKNTEGDAGGVSSALLLLAQRVGESATRDVKDFWILNSVLDRIWPRLSKANQEAVDARLQKAFPYCRRVVQGTSLTKAPPEGFRKKERVVQDASVVQIKAIGGLDEQGDGIEIGAVRDYVYLPHGYLTCLRYQLHLKEGEQKATVLIKPTERGARLVEPLLPKYGFPSSSYCYVYSEADSSKSAWFVGRRVWSVDEIATRLGARWARCTDNAAKEKVGSEIREVSEHSNLDFSAGMVTEWFKAQKDNANSFLLNSSLDEYSNFGHLFGSSEDLRREGESLPARKLAELLAQNGKSFGFELGDATQLLDIGLNARGRKVAVDDSTEGVDKEDVPKAEASVGICVVIALQ